MKGDILMKEPEENRTQQIEKETNKETKKQPLSETWSQDAQDELQEFIELQGIYIRQ